MPLPIGLIVKKQTWIQIIHYPVPEKSWSALTILVLKVVGFI